MPYVRGSLISDLNKMEIERDDVLSLLESVSVDDSLTSDYEMRRILLFRYPKEEKRIRHFGLE